MLLNIFSHGTEHQELFSKIFKATTIHSSNSLLLIQDGVYFGIYIKELSQYKNIYALEQDVIARGLINSYPKNITLINYEQFVNLVIEHEKNITY